MVNHLFTINEDGSGGRKILDCGMTGSGCVQPEWSPDGSSIVYVKAGSSGAPQLWLTDPEGKSQTQLTNAPNEISFLPTWMPDSQRVVFDRRHPSTDPKDDRSDSQLFVVDTQSMKEQPLFAGDHPGYADFSSSVSPDGSQLAFVSNRSGLARVYLASVDGSDAKELSSGPTSIDLQGDGRITPIEQKVPSLSPDGRYVAHWEGVEMIYLSQFTGITDPVRDQLITETWHVWIVDVATGERHEAGKGDDPIWSPDGRVSRAYPDPAKGGPTVQIQSAPGADTWQELPILPFGTKNWGRFSWAPADLLAVV